MKNTEINIRDPFVLLHEDKYYLYGTRSATCWGPADGFDCYVSSDMVDWDGPVEIFHRPEGFFADAFYWAPECYEYNGKFYLVATLGTLDNSIKKGCRTQNDVSRYLYLFQGFTQDTMMLMGNLLKWKFRIPGFMKKMVRKLTDSTVHDILTKDTWNDDSVRKSVFAVRKYQQMLGFSEGWIQEYVYNLIALAKKEPNPSQEEVAKAEAKLKK